MVPASTDRSRCIADGADRGLGRIHWADSGHSTLRVVAGFGHSSGIPALRKTSNAGCRIGLRPVNHLMLSLG